MNDQELLEKAAKAAGVDGPICEMIGGSLYVANKTTSLGMWSPLTDDGDALRLALKLRINVEHMALEVMAHKGDVMCVEPNDGVYAAARRAIVRAAAELAG